MSAILFIFYGECLNKKALEGVDDFKISRQITRTVKYVDELVLLAKKKTVLQGMTDAIEWEKNVGKLRL
jgi:hypothetical protein